MSRHDGARRCGIGRRRVTMPSWGFGIAGWFPQSNAVLGESESSHRRFGVIHHPNILDHRGISAFNLLSRNESLSACRHTGGVWAICFQTMDRVPNFRGDGSWPRPRWGGNRTTFRIRPARHILVEVLIRISTLSMSPQSILANTCWSRSCPRGTPGFRVDGSAAIILHHVEKGTRPPSPRKWRSVGT